MNASHLALQARRMKQLGILAVGIETVEHPVHYPHEIEAEPEPCNKNAFGFSRGLFMVYIRAYVR